LEKIQRLPNQKIPLWLPQAVEGLKRKAEEEQKAYDSVPAFDDATLVRDGIFGPRSDGLSMKLPNAYPTRAGQAKDALKVAVKDHEKQLKKIEKERIPTAEELLRAEEHPPPKKPFIKLPEWFYERQRRKEMARDIRTDVSTNLLVHSMYESRRRSTLAALPGIQTHYPNPNNPDCARLPLDYLPLPPEKDPMIFSKQKMVPKTGNTIIAVDHVGRKGKTLIQEGKESTEKSRPQENTLEKNENDHADDGSSITSCPINDSHSEGEARVPLTADGYEVATFAKSQQQGLFSKKPIIPPEVYLDRRGSFHISPGLEEFSTVLKKSAEEIDAERIAKKAHAKALRASGENIRKRPASYGLLCVLHTNVCLSNLLQYGT
jgi:hypothetical protein